MSGYSYQIQDEEDFRPIRPGHPVEPSGLQAGLNKKTSPIRERVESSMCALSELEAAICRLGDKLNPIMSEQPPQKEREAVVQGSSPTDPSSEMSAGLGEILYRINQATRNIALLTNRLEV